MTKDVRGQIKFLEELDKSEQKRHEEQEREILLRAAKSRSRLEDPEQAKLKAKVLQHFCSLENKLISNICRPKKCSELKWKNFAKGMLI